MGLRNPQKPSDYPTLTLYIFDKTHVTVTALTALSILYTRNAHIIYFSVGALLSSLTAKSIKKLIKTPRPPPPPPPTKITPSTSSSSSKPTKTPHPRPKKTYGMPSTHSTALTFYLSYILPILLFPPPHSSSSHLSPITRSLAILGVVGYWFGGLWSRVELGYHDYKQVGGGAGLGVIMALLWRVGWEVGGFGKGLQGLVDQIWGFTLGRI